MHCTSDNVFGFHSSIHSNVLVINSTVSYLCPYSNPACIKQLVHKIPNNSRLMLTAFSKHALTENKPNLLQQTHDPQHSFPAPGTMAYDMITTKMRTNEVKMTHDHFIACHLCLVLGIIIGHEQIMHNP